MDLGRIIGSLGEGVRILGAERGRNAVVTGIGLDSREISGKDGRGPVFAALPGTHTHGSEFIAEAVARGAVCVLTSRPVDGLEAVQIISDDVRGTLSAVSDFFYGSPSRRLVMVGVTGTNGKTTVAHIIESILGGAGFRTALLGTLYHRWAGRSVRADSTTPEAPLLHSMLARMVDDGVTHCVMEVSSHALAQKRVEACAFNAGVFTNLSHDHLDFHHTMEEYFRAKSVLFKRLINGPVARSAVINIDDEWGGRLLRELDSTTSFGLSEAASVRPSGYSLGAEGISARIETPSGAVEVESALIGEYNLYNILAATGVGIALGLDAGAVSAGISALAGVPGRLERVGPSAQTECGAGIKAYVDYAHTPDALERTLAVLRPLSSGRIITVFGCGGNRDREKRAPMGSAAAAGSDIAVITSDNPRDEDPLGIIAEIEAGIAGLERLDNRTGAEIEGRGYAVIPDRAEAIRWAVAAAHPGETVLVAGKGHERYQIVKGERRGFDDASVLADAVAEIYGASALEAAPALKRKNG